MEGRSPWYLAYRRLRRNRTALAFGALFVLIVVFSLAAPLWANEVADTGPNATHTLEKVEVDGETREVVDPEGRPVGPLWLGAGGKFFLGADGRLGRDEMVRLMYGGRTSLFVGIVAALITVMLGTALGLLAGYYRGWVDAVIARTLDVVWAFPVILLAIALGLIVGFVLLGLAVEALYRKLVRERPAPRLLALGLRLAHELGALAVPANLGDPDECVRAVAAHAGRHSHVPARGIALDRRRGGERHQLPAREEERGVAGGDHAAERDQE